MQLNDTTGYAIRVVLYLADKEGGATSHEIAAAMGIPQNYVLKITRKLVAVGFINRTLGINGGFGLGKRAEDITLYDIMQELEPTTKLNRCLEDDKYCSRFATENCPVRRFYCKLQGELEAALQKMTVRDLLEYKIG